jgi:hypothetical protein
MTPKFALAHDRLKTDERALNSQKIRRDHWELVFNMNELLRAQLGPMASEST